MDKKADYFERDGVTWVKGMTVWAEFGIGRLYFWVVQHHQKRWYQMPWRLSATLLKKKS